MCRPWVRPGKPWTHFCFAPTTTTTIPGELEIGIDDVAAVLSGTPGQVLGFANLDASGTSFLAVLQALQKNTRSRLPRK